MLQNRTPASRLAGDSLLSAAPPRASTCEDRNHGEPKGGRLGRAAPSQATSPGNLSALGRAEPVAAIRHRGPCSSSRPRGRVSGSQEGPAGAADTADEAPVGNLVTRPVAALLVHYKRWISPLLPRACRFTPTCSEYARLAILQYGLVRGGARALWRILRCNPFHPGGVDLP